MISSLKKGKGKEESDRGERSASLEEGKDRGQKNSG
jgi:hypothetical protein